MKVYSIFDFLFYIFHGFGSLVFSFIISSYSVFYSFSLAISCINLIRLLLLHLLFFHLLLPLLFLLGGIFIVENGKQKGIYFKVSKKERDLIEQKMALAGVHNMSGYIRKMAIDGYVVNLEIPELPECASLLRYISNNVNQMARQMNSGGAVYPDEAHDICIKQDKTMLLFGKILEQLSRLK